MAGTSEHPSALTARSLLVPALLLLLTVVAAGLRLYGLNAPDGQMLTDEARLALSAKGVVEHGIPVMPSGYVATRGMLNSYLAAPSIFLLGPTDFAARLPSVIGGILLVPAAYLLGRAFTGAAAGLLAATFIALTEPFVEVSRSAWLPSIFLLLLALSVYAGYRGFVLAQAGWQVAFGALFLLALLSYEFAVILPAGVALSLAIVSLGRQLDWYRGRPTLLSLGLMVAGVALFVGLALALRAPTVAGPMGEVSAKLDVSRGLAGVRIYWREVFSSFAPMVVASAFGLLLLGWKRPRASIYLGSLLALSFLVPAFVLQGKLTERYMLTCLLLIGVSAGVAIDLAGALAGRLGPGQGVASKALLGVILLALTLAPNTSKVQEVLAEPSPEPTWLQAIKVENPPLDEPLLVEAPTVVHYALGRAEYSFQNYNGWERYTVRAPDTPRLLYSGSILILRRGDFERLIERPLAGRRIWVIGREPRLRKLAGEVESSLLSSLLRSADRIIETPDEWVLARVPLPRQPAGSTSRQR